MAKRFEGQTVFITGASSGIGAELSRAFAREGANVALAARRADILRANVEAIHQEGGRALAVACDVHDRASLDAAVAATVEAFGGIDVAVANAGFGVSGAFWKLTPDDFRRQFETNFFGVLNTVYAVMPHLEKSKGRLGLVSSVLGRLGAPATAPYCASKFAVCGLAESLYFDLAEKGITVTCINPGIVASNIRMTGNDGVLREGRPDPAPAWIIVPTDRAARAIVTALYRRQFEAVITGHGKAAAFFARHFPRTTRWLMRASTGGRMESVEKAKRGSSAPGKE
ncbi:MAG: SDR family NAD(P)-dependent oxidoreductase [Candidatus Hydrogenedentes bacterium]|nr:SDR family NAD(P)-dependent oxidoreductase [Candidatus Hydrogenedentota bacterium]